MQTPIHFSSGSPTALSGLRQASSVEPNQARFAANELLVLPEADNDALETRNLDIRQAISQTLGIYYEDHDDLRTKFQKAQKLSGWLEFFRVKGKDTFDTKVYDAVKNLPALQKKEAGGITTPTIGEALKAVNEALGISHSSE